VSPTARRLLIERHLPLVHSIARRYAGEEPLDDLAQIGAIGLIKAADRYDAARGVAFPTFAAPFVAGEIRHHLRDRAAPVRVPRRLQEQGVRVTAVELEHAADAAHADLVGQAHDRLALRAALRSLHPNERRVVALRYVEDLSQAQIARRTGLSQVHVSRTLRAALLRLHEQLASSNG
jgi:RNA polymerase sigma-B factor